LTARFGCFLRDRGVVGAGDGVASAGFCEVAFSCGFFFLRGGLSESFVDRRRFCERSLDEPMELSVDFDVPPVPLLAGVSSLSVVFFRDCECEVDLEDCGGFRVKLYPFFMSSLLISRGSPSKKGGETKSAVFTSARLDAFENVVSGAARDLKLDGLSKAAACLPVAEVKSHRALSNTGNDGAHGRRPC
jgi:hypothetical protein